jgi:hypothetical protein
LQAAGSAMAAATMPQVVYAPQPQELEIDRDYHVARIEEFEAAEDASRRMRERAERDVDYYDNKQLTEEEFRELEKRGQPPVTLNMIRQKIDYLLGLEKTSRSKPRALPRTRKHEDDAFAVGDALKYVSDDNRYPQLRRNAATERGRSDAPHCVPPVQVGPHVVGPAHGRGRFRRCQSSWACALDGPQGRHSRVRGRRWQGF